MLTDISRVESALNVVNVILIS